MKKFIVSLMMVSVFSVLYAQTDCKPYIPTATGTVWELTNYSAKDKETGKTVYELVNKAVTGNTITFKVKSVSYDQKGKEIFSNTYDAKCVDGKFEFNMAFKMDGGAMQAYRNMDVAIDASEFEIPPMNAPAGTNLPDGSLKVSMGGAIGLNMTVLVTDRKIAGKESVTTPAGTFDCLILSQNVSTKIIVSVKGASKEWYAPQVGLVKSESYNKGGKLTGYSLLTKLNKK